MRTSVALSLAALLAAPLGWAAPPGWAAGNGPGGAAHAMAAQPFCDRPVGGAHQPCQIVLRPADASSAGYGPNDLQAAYGLQSASSGMRQTVAVVTAFDYPTADADLATYRGMFGIPACSKANGCFRQVNQAGRTDAPPPADALWAAAGAAELDTVSAVCPNCHLILVESASAAVPDMGAAVNEAVSLGARFVDIGWSVPETPAETGYDASYFDHPGVALVAPSAQAAPNTDGAGLIGYPAASPHVVAVGGTTLSRVDTGVRGWSETAWRSSGSGCSAYEPKPARQKDTGCATRTVNDVAADADPTASPVASWDSYGDSTIPAPGWSATGGTPVAAAIITGVFALTSTPRAGQYPTDFPYSHAGALNDITAGSTGTCAPAYLCTAGSGYDAPTGIGTPWYTTGFDYTGQQGGALYSGVPGKCADDEKAATADHNPIDIFTCNGGDNQNWTLLSGGTVQVLGKCMDVTGGGTTNGTKVELYTCNGTGAQQWRVRADGQLVNPGSGRCLDDPSGSTTNATQLDIHDCTDISTATGPIAVPGERWTAPYATPTSVGAVSSAVDAGLCIDDRQGSNTNGTVIETFTCNGGTAQSVTIAAHGELQVAGGCLDVVNAGTADGTKVQLWSCIGDGQQQWRVLSDGSLRSPQSGKCLTDPGASTAIRTQLVISACTGGPEQRWLPH